MDFNFTPKEEMFRRMVKMFTERELIPRAKELATMDHIPWDIIKRVGEMGFSGLGMPEKYGGQPATWVTIGIAFEEMARAYHLVAGLLVTPLGNTLLVAHHGTEEAKEEWLRAMIKGDKLGCLALTEPGCGSDAAAITTRAVRDGDSYIITGEKTSISLATQAHCTALFVKTDPKAGAKGVTCFLCPLDLPGITKSKFTDMGWHPGGRASLVFDEVRIPAKYRLGEEGQGFYLAMGIFDDLFRVLSGLGPLVMAQVALEHAIAYATQRTAFGKPIAKWEGVSFQIAEGATFIEAARWLCYRALWLKDQGQPNTKEAAMVKWWVPKLAVKVIHDCLLIHGNVGYSDEYPLQQMLRDAMGYEIADGTAQIMKIIIARELMGKVAVPYAP